MKKLYVQTYGCQMNQYDSERIVRLMEGAGYEAAGRIEEADLILLNTCSVRDKSEQKVYSALGRWSEFKARRQNVIIGVGGCVAQQEGERLLKRVPHLDLVFGTHNIHKLPQMVEQARLLNSRPVEIGFFRDPSYMEEPSGRTTTQGPKAFVPIMQGCDKVCSFCVVPYVRGREVSRPSEEVVAEIESLVQRGIQEVMLLGQNVNSYGKKSANGIGFAELLARVDAIEGLERIRFTTSHPEDLSPELIAAYATLDKLCEHLHLPVQSGADSVLSRMRRGYTRADYLERIGRLKERRPDVALSTDIIVGFPGETDGEFEQTLEILRQVEYDEIFSFAYSPRPQTVSAKIYRDDVPEPVKKERLKEVQNLQRAISLKRNRRKIGQEEEILIEGSSKFGNRQVMGRTRSNRIVNVGGALNLTGSMVRVRITGASANSLLGELASAVPAGDPPERMERRETA